MKLYFQENLRKIDLTLIVVVLILVSFGLLMIYSATSGGSKGENTLIFFKKQLIAAFLGIFVLVFFAWIDYNWLRHYISFIYAFIFILLLIVVLTGRIAQGAQRWILIGGFNLQPSEFAKIVLIICLASLFSEKKAESLENSDVLRAFAYLIPLMLLIFIQPDLGTALVLSVILLSMLLVAQAKVVHFGAIFLVGLVLFLVVWQFHLLRDYQIKRLIVFLNPNIDPLGSGYNLQQAMIAIGSGGVIGKGLFSGTQTNLKFIPARHTDFIFAVIGEELGFFGACFLLFLYFLLNFRALSIALSSKNIFGTLIAIGLSSMWLFQIITNIGMNLGIMPITGIPLPFISSGGSSLLANMIGVGLLLSIYRKRFG